MTSPDTLLQVLSKAFNTNSRPCQEIFYAAKANRYRHLAENKVAFTNKVRPKSAAAAKVTACSWDFKSGNGDGRELGRQDQTERSHQRRLFAQSRGDYLRGGQA